MLEEIGGLRRRTSPKHQPGIGKLIERGMQFGLAAVRHRCEQLVGKIPADCGADLGNLLGPGAEPIEPRHQ